jgi:hypothetical protein
MRLHYKVAIEQIERSIFKLVLLISSKNLIFGGPTVHNHIIVRVLRKNINGSTKTMK